MPCSWSQRSDPSGLEPATSRSQVKHCNTESLHSLWILLHFRYAYIDEKDDKRDHKPVVRKTVRQDSYMYAICLRVF